VGQIEDMSDCSKKKGKSSRKGEDYAHSGQESFNVVVKMRGENFEGWSF